MQQFKYKFPRRLLQSFAMLILVLGCIGIVDAQSATQVTAGQDKQDELKSIFDGTLDGWSGDSDLWRVENGVIVGESTKEAPLKRNQFLIWGDGKLDDFELRLQYKISGTEKANSGVQIRSFLAPNGHLCGYQADIARKAGITGSLYSEKTGRGMLCWQGKTKDLTVDAKANTASNADAAAAAQKLDQWNELSIVATGTTIVVSVNGVETARFNDSTEKLNEKGLLGLQLHQGPPMKIEFKDIRLRRLKLKDKKKIVFVAGKKSHGWGKHEHHAGCLLLEKCLNEFKSDTGLPVLTTVYKDGWPRDKTAFDNADTVVVFADGGPKHPLHSNGEAFEHIMREGVGLVCLHYGVEVPPGKSGQRFLDWIGGYFETNWSVNPHWEADFKELPEHQVTRGVKPFKMNDEWYYHMRFSSKVDVTPILSALPSAKTLTRKDGPHHNNPHVRAAVLERKELQHVAWAFVRGDGKGRGFGFTGAHFHKNWANDNARKLVLNAIIWTAKVEVPENGVESKTPTEAELDANQDYPKSKRGDKEKRRVKKQKKLKMKQKENGADDDQ